jgi:hypothetical protein
VKERTRQTNAQAVRESDSVIVPEKSPNKGNPVPAEAMEGRALAKRNADEDAATQAQPWTLALFDLDGVRQPARRSTGNPATGNACIQTCRRSWMLAGRHHSRQEPYAVVPHVRIRTGGAG